LTYNDPVAGDPRPALIVLDEGATLLGTLDLVPEGSGFIVGADMDAGFGGGGFGAAMPRAIELNPVDISGQTDVRLTVALAATDADWELTPDFLRVMVGQSGAPPEEFVTLSTYIGVDMLGIPAHKGLSADGGATYLLPSAFTDVSWNISQLAPNITDLVVRFEAISTFPNEIVAIDNVRIHSGELGGGGGVDGDYNNNGRVEQADLDLVLLNWGDPAEGLPAEWAHQRPASGNVDQAELDGVLLNWGNSAALGAAGVPEPGGIGLALAVAVVATIFARRRGR
jgi:hypothetical protein